MEKFDPSVHRCPFGLLCMASIVALSIFLLTLFLVG